MRNYELYELLSTGLKVGLLKEDLSILLKDSDRLLSFIDSLNHDTIETRKLTKITRHDVFRAADKLEDSIILINDRFPAIQSLGRKYYACYKRLLLIEVLDMLRMRKIVILLSNDLMRKSEKYYFLNIALATSKLIVRNEVQVLGIHKGIKTNKKFEEFLEFIRIENSIEVELYEVQNQLLSLTIAEQDILNFCKKSIAYYSKYEKKIPSFYFHVSYYCLINIKFQILNDKTGVINNAIKACNWFAEFASEYKPGIVIFKTYLVLTYLKTKQFDLAFSTINETFKLVASKSTYWFRLQEYKILGYLRSGNYQEATDLFFGIYTLNLRVAVMTSDVFRWELLEAYIYFLLDCEICKYEGRKKRFNVLRYINDLPDFTVRRRTENIPILIVQMLFFIVRKQYEKATDRVNSMSRYTKKYLINDSSFRSNCFIKMLVEIPKQGFNKMAVERKTKRYYIRLIESETKLFYDPHESEIIPYEDLWEIILGILPDKGHYKSVETSANR